MEPRLEERSKLYALQPLVQKLPEVEIPKRRISFKERLAWSGLAIALFLIMAQVPLYGIDPERAGLAFFGYLRYVLASHAGTLMELGITPIVTSGIIMQLLVGSKLINLNLTDPEDRALFTGVQKFLAIALGVFQASTMVIGGWYGVGLGASRMAFLIIQLSLGALIVIYLDELVSKYGFGSGISLFIAASVSATIFWQAFNPMVERGVGQVSGAVAFLVHSIITGGSITDAFFRQGLPNMMGALATLLIFFVVVYAESMRVEIPLAYSRFGGIRGRYPIRFFYTSVIPVILAMVIFSNVRLFGTILQNRGFPILGTFDSRGNPTSGLAYYLRTPNGIFEVMAEPLRAAVYFLVLVGLCMAFAWLWIHMTGMGPKDIAQQLDRAGMLIPGFRRDIRVMERVLERYIYTVTLLGGAAVGALSAAADFLGALGSGTGILLTVGILYGLYQEIARERVFEMFPAARRLFGA